MQCPHLRIPIHHQNDAHNSSLCGEKKIRRQCLPRREELNEDERFLVHDGDEVVRGERDDIRGLVVSGNKARSGEERAQTEEGGKTHRVRVRVQVQVAVNRAEQTLNGERVFINPTTTREKLRVTF